MASKGQRMKDLQRVTTEFLPTFGAETDRGCVLLAAALMEGHLEKMLTTKLVKTPEKEDPLLDLYFGRKIALAYRLGLISEKLRRDLNALKDIRNHFAHNIFDCDFQNSYIKGKLSEFKKSFAHLEGLLEMLRVIAKRVKEIDMALRGTAPKAEFLVFMLALQIDLKVAANRIKQSIDRAETENAFLDLLESLE